MSYTLIASQTLAANTGSVTFAGIPQQYTDLMLEFIGSETVAAHNLYLQFNGVATSTYSGTALWGTGSAASSDRRSNQTYFYVDRYGNGTAPASAQIHVMSYTNTSINKTSLIRFGAASGNTVEAHVGLWSSTAAITSVTLGGGGLTLISSGSIARLWGVA